MLLSFQNRKQSLATLIAVKIKCETLDSEKLLESDLMSENLMPSINGDNVSGLTGVGGEAEDDDGLEQQPQRARHAPAGQPINQTKSK